VCAFASTDDDSLKFVFVESDWINTQVPLQPRPWLIGHLLLLLVVVSCGGVTHVSRRTSQSSRHVSERREAPGEHRVFRVAPTHATPLVRHNTAASRNTSSGNAMVRSICDTRSCDLTRADLPFPDPNRRRTPSPFGCSNACDHELPDPHGLAEDHFFCCTFDNRIDTTPVGAQHPVCAHHVP
jgi:hypothetical protein